ncbi:MAG TPA: ABC transporter permease, partial [Bacillota bacterium]|nr:ABC transporter permease [Bacillota bacterium]
MTVLPIVGRELRVAARRRSTYWLRTGAALLVMAIGTWVFLMMQHESPRQIAQVLFGILTGGAVLYALLSGLRSTADCLSEEKREGTLGLLFLTDLKGYDVVFGKLAATSLSAFYGVLAVMPMLAIPLLLGGLTPSEFGRMTLVALNALFFSLTAGIFVSSQSRSAQRAVSATLLVLLGFAALLPALGGLLVSLGTISPTLRQALSLFLLPSVGYSYYMAWDSTYRFNGQHFWWSMLVIHGLSWVFLVLASLVVPFTWQDKPAGVQRLRWRERCQNWSFGNLAERSAFRRQLLDQ